MIRFFNEVYLTGFTILFRISRAKKITYKAGGAVAAIMMIQWLILIEIPGYVAMYYGKKMPDLSKPEILVITFAIYLVNLYVLYIRGYGIRFEREFDSLEKPKRILLRASCAVLLLASIALYILSTIAYRRYIGAS
jgi:hypothetical protein